VIILTAMTVKVKTMPRQPSPLCSGRPEIVEATQAPGPALPRRETYRALAGCLRQAREPTPIPASPESCAPMSPRGGDAPALSGHLTSRGHAVENRPRRCLVICHLRRRWSRALARATARPATRIVEMPFLTAHHLSARARLQVDMPSPFGLSPSTYTSHNTSCTYLWHGTTWTLAHTHAHTVPLEHKPSTLEHLNL